MRMKAAQLLTLLSSTATIIAVHPRMCTDTTRALATLPSDTVNRTSPRPRSASTAITSKPSTTRSDAATAPKVLARPPVPPHQALGAASGQARARCSPRMSPDILRRHRRPWELIGLWSRTPRDPRDLGDVTKGDIIVALVIAMSESASATTTVPITLVRGTIFRPAAMTRTRTAKGIATTLPDDLSTSHTITTADGCTLAESAGMTICHMCPTFQWTDGKDDRSRRALQMHPVTENQRGRRRVRQRER